ncbi:unnamed protein product [Rotaria sordida]|uniref:Uncharacterized protein n=1 Tax=Rotaria sordida TaxID=392033 RepID=A0A814LPQ0_9BILA|nr:unnamed protein product [Rotaria sordida]CAF1323679.1 unnamed protein product [Rotaria sordida]CAF1324738.1 unnamed protein product [Rotaria sordida]
MSDIERMESPPLTTTQTSRPTCGVLPDWINIDPKKSYHDDRPQTELQFITFAHCSHIAQTFNYMLRSA